MGCSGAKHASRCEALLADGLLYIRGRQLLGNLAITEHVLGKSRHLDQMKGEAAAPCAHTWKTEIVSRSGMTESRLSAVSSCTTKKALEQI